MNILLVLLFIQFKYAISNDCPGGSLKYKENCYWWHTENNQIANIDRQTADEICALKNGTVVSFDDLEEKNEIVYRIRHSPLFSTQTIDGISVWVGLRNNDTSNWQWETNDKFKDFRMQITSTFDDDGDTVNFNDLKYAAMKIYRNRELILFARKVADTAQGYICKGAAGSGINFSNSRQKEFDNIELAREIEGNNKRLTIVSTFSVLAVICCVGVVALIVWRHRLKGGFNLDNNKE